MSYERELKPLRVAERESSVLPDISLLKLHESSIAAYRNYSCSLTSSYDVRCLPAVCALLIILAGAAVIPTLPIAQFPNLAPPQVGVSSFYIGASAQTVESAVTIPLEQQINGAEGMKYITSTSGNDGTSQISVTFDLTRDPDLATVDIQNRVNTAQGRLPSAVKAVGITTQKTSQNFVFGAAVTSDNNKYSTAVHEQLPRRVRAGRAEANSGSRRRLHLRRAQVLDAAVAGPGADGGTRA